MCLTPAGRRRTGWYAVLSAHFTWLLWSGLNKSLGVMLPILMEEFSAPTWLVGWTVAIFIATINIVGPLAAPLEFTFGTRGVVMASGVAIGASLIIASQTTSLAQLTVTLALGAGLGISFANILTRAMIGRRFTTYYATANGIAHAGSAFGLGISFANILTRAMIGRRFTTYYATANGIAHAGSAFGMIIVPPLAQLFLDTYGWRGTMLLFGGISLNLVVCGALLRPHSAKEDATYLPVPSRVEGDEKLQSNSFKDKLMAVKKLFGISICYRISFWITCLINISVNLVANLWFIYYVDHIQQKGFSPQDAVAFTTAAGLGSLIFKIGFGPVIDRGFFKLRCSIILLTIIGSVTLLIDPWINSYWLLMASAFIFFGCAGGLNSINDMFTKELVGSEFLASAFSWMELMAGILSFAIGFFPGWVFDQSGSYDVAFVIMGCVYAMSLVALFIKYVMKVTPSSAPAV